MNVWGNWEECRRPCSSGGLGWQRPTALHRAWGAVGRGWGRNDRLGIRDPPQSPASLSSNVSPLVAFSAVLEAFFFWAFQLAELWRRTFI